MNRIVILLPVIALLAGVLVPTAVPVRASIDCSQPDPDSRCSEVQNSPPPPPSCDATTPDGQCISHHGGYTVYCLAGVFLGTWLYPPNAANVGNEVAFCQALP